MSATPPTDSREVIHFLHIGKTGGSAVKAALRDRTDGARYRVKFHGHHRTSADLRPGKRSAFFLRDPVSRFVSGFYSRQRKGRPLYHSEWSPREREVFERFATPNDVAVALAEGDPAAVRAMGAVQHFRRTNKWYGDLEYFTTRVDDIFFVGFQETLDADFATLRTLLGVSEAVDLPSDDVAAHRNTERVDRTVDEVGLAALQDWYAEDYVFLSTCRELMAERSSQA